jgi:hypothetical protein
MADWSDLIGLRFEDAVAKAKQHGFVVREYFRDGEASLVTADYRTDRIGVDTETVGGELRVCRIQGIG